MNPGHKQKKSQEPDAPQWYIDAYLDALKYGAGLVVFRPGTDPEYIPPERYLEIAEALKWSDKQINGSEPIKQ
jgi:hypothetical protein